MQPRPAPDDHDHVRLFYEDDVPTQWTDYTKDNARFFTDILPGRDGPLDSPGGAAKVGPTGVDTPLVAGLPPQAEEQLP